MAETIELGCDGTEKWHWYNVRSDLLREGRGWLDERLLSIAPLLTTTHGCGGQYGDVPFYITWVKDKFMLLTMKEIVPELVWSFAEIVGYNPFVQYELNGMITVEWDNEDLDSRLSQIRKLDGVTMINEDAWSYMV